LKEGINGRYSVNVRQQGQKEIHEHDPKGRHVPNCRADLVGEYRVTVEPIADAKAKIVLPPRYASEETSSIVVAVQADKNSIALNLVK